MNITPHQMTKISRNARSYAVLISGKEVFIQVASLENALDFANRADKMYPAEVIWICDSDRNPDPLSALDEFNGTCL